MNRIVFAILVIVIAVALSGIASAATAPAAEKANDKNLVPVDVIHWQKGYAKPGGGGGNDNGPTCYAFLKYGKTLLKWNTTPVSYVINPSGAGLDPAFNVGNVIKSAAETWDAATGVELFNNKYKVDNTAVWGALDSKNVLTWGDYPQAGVIAVTRYWINTTTKSIAEFDIMFDTDFAWGDAESDPSLMDVQNIATHELGHGIGLSDVYKVPCGTVTMYGYSNNGDISKRSLETPDITGLQALYGP